MVTRKDVVAIAINPWENYTGSRVTYITYSAELRLTDGTYVKVCDHMHRTTEAARACGRKAWKALED